MTFLFRRRMTTREIFVFSACLAALLVYLGLERFRLERALRKVSRRIAVTGTRGKSGTARLIAAGLRASGARVLAKTTGSKPMLIFPDGSEREILRPGPASIREQIRLASLAARTGADTLVAEMMSIGPECLSAESRAVLRPAILALTNVRLDHLEEMGRTKEDIARTLAGAFPEEGIVFLPEEEMRAAFEASAARLKAKLVPVPAKGLDGPADAGPGLLPWEFEPNVRLALAVLEHLGIDRASALKGMAGASPDLGSLKIRRAEFGSPPRPVVCVSAFAANDPGSSAEALERAQARVPFEKLRLVGILSLREDRGDRTLQWLGAAREGFFREFELVLVIGVQARAFVRKIRRALGREADKFELAKDPKPEKLMDIIISRAERDAVVVGLGNIAGPGERLVRYWDAHGVAVDH